MNTARREEIKGVLKSLSALSAKVEKIRDEEDEARDNMPESFQDTEKYEASENASDALDNALDYMNDAEGLLEEALQ